MEWDRLGKTSVTIQPSPYPSSDSSTTKTHLSSPATRSLKSSRGADSELGSWLALPDRLLGGSEPKFSQQEGCWKWGSGRRGGGAEPSARGTGAGLCPRVVPGAVGSAVGERAGSSCSCLPRSCCPCGCLGPVWGTASSSLPLGAQLKGLLARSKLSSPVPLLPCAQIGLPKPRCPRCPGGCEPGLSAPSASGHRGTFEADLPL